jgi:hypothetical protein
MTGWAAGQNYNPTALNAIYESPWTILKDVFGSGMSDVGPGYNSLRDIGADPLTLYNIMVGGDKNFAGSTENPQGNYANWLANLYNQMGTTGGRGFSMGELSDQIFNPGANSSLKQILTQGDASMQMRTLFNMLREASNVGMNPLAARGYQGALARAGDDAIRQTYHSDADQGANNRAVYETIARNVGLNPNR